IHPGPIIIPSQSEFIVQFLAVVAVAVFHSRGGGQSSRSKTEGRAGVAEERAPFPGPGHSKNG
ncbi:MAG: hypothetical protein D6711_19095, partial [Chloroflexi bacterium]